ncbi:MAG: HDOD domain-containing protein [Planctomycetota bacterium]|jgi:HD-like signal output (HDOD) protein
MSDTAVAVDASNAIKIAMSKIGDIATLPEITARIISVVDDPKSTAKDLHNIIKNDPALATKILKVVNSAFYGLPGQISEIDRAIVLLGLSAVKNIAISASISRLFAADKISDRFSARDIWKHSVAVAVAARQLCAIMGMKSIAEEAFLAGLIHDLGLLVERQAFFEQLSEVLRLSVKDKRHFCDIETELIGADHQVLGCALTTKWKFPRVLQTVVGYHHKFEFLSPENRLLPRLVYIADTICCREKIGFHLCAENQPISDEVLSDTGIAEVDLQAVIELLPEYIETAESILMA